MKKKKALKENPLMKDNKSPKSIKLTKVNESEDEVEIKNFIFILIILGIFIAIIYFGTEFLGNKKNDDVTVTNQQIDYDKVVVGTILNRPYDEYYVFVYNKEDSKAVKYSALMTAYKDKSYEDEYIKIYYCDLGNKLNSKYYNVNNDNKSNTSPKETKDFDFGDVTLLKVKKGKVVEYIESYDKIKEKLK